MICYWKYDNGYHEVDEWQPRCWIRVSNPTADEMTQLEERWQVPLDFVHDAEDADERPRLDTEDGWLLTLVRIPGRETDEDGEVVFTTRPLAILIRDDVCITVGFFPSEVLSDFIAWSNRKHQPKNNTIGSQCSNTLIVNQSFSFLLRVARGARLYNARR